MSLLETRNLTMRFGGLTALDNVSFTVQPAEIVTVIGPNGAGKTTLFNAISSVYAPTSGDILYRGRSIVGLRPYEIARLGIGRTFQIVRSFRDLSVLNNVMAAYATRFNGGFLSSLGSYKRASYQDECMTLLRGVGLAGYEHQLAKNLPLGLSRLLEIARALALNPALVLLDETFSGLSHLEVSAQMEVVRALKAEGKAVLLIEHNMPVAMSLSDRIVVLSFGKQIAEGTPDQVQANPAVVDAYLGEEDSVTRGAAGA